MTLSEELTWRGFINQSTITNLQELDEKKLKFYHGYDASVDSLTIGNLAGIMMDKVFIRHGWSPVILSGGATSLIGDPGGKDAERSLQSVEQVTKNVEAVSLQIKGLFDTETKFVNNLEWFSKMSVLEFLRDVGKHFSMTPLIQRDYIAKRLGAGGSGISFTEFSYTLLQGFDFLYLYKNYDVVLQLAGSDQWGNSLSGVDLVRRVEGKEVNVLTCPLIINKATGKKFGKSEEGAIWLDPSRTSAYKFYQFWLNTEDEAVEDYLKIYTQLDKPTIDQLLEEFHNDRGQRLAQKTLAYEVTKLVHTKATAYSNLQTDDFLALKEELPLISVDVGQPILKSLVDNGFMASNSEARRFFEQKAIYLNGQTLVDDRQWQNSDFLDGHHAIVRRGKNNNAIIQCL